MVLRYQECLLRPSFWNSDVPSISFHFCCVFFFIEFSAKEGIKSFMDEDILL